MRTWQLIFLKFKTVLYRFVAVFWFLPARVSRFFRHLLKGFQFYVPGRKTKDTTDGSLLKTGTLWWIQLFFTGLECVGIAEVYETIIDLGKLNTRPLTSREIKMARSVFGNSINYERVRIDEKAWMGPKQQRFCYVSFNVINSWGKMPDNLFIHELVHIWQFQNLGAIYVPKALEAQFSAAGYNYGGVESLRVYAFENKSFLDFNFEQQGDIVSDYFLLRSGGRPQWGNATIQDLAVYEYFIDQLRQ